MTLASQSDESKFAHLLQPIRDLAANWDIDVASELEDYLDTLENLTFAFDGGPTLNFAEAALVIQGSACVYGRKVEYLHSLVHQALDFVAERRKKDTHKKAHEQTADEPDFSDDEERFLNLDDTLEEGTAIDMEESQNSTRTPINRAPGALLALEDRGRGERDGDASNFQLGRCCIHRSGALLLEQRDGDQLDEFLRRMDAGSAPPQASPAAAGPAQQHDGHAAEGAAPADQPMGPADSVGEEDGGAAFWEDSAHPMDDDGRQQADAAAPAEPPPWLEGEAAEPREPSGNSGQHAEQPEEPVWDPYTPLDPHDPGTLPIAPYRRMRKRRGRARQKQKHLPSHSDSLLATLLGPMGFVAGGKSRFPEFAYAHQAAKPVRRQAQDTRQPAASLSAFTRAEATASQAQDDAEGDNAEGQGPDGMEDTGPAGSIFSDDDDAGGYGGPNFDDAEDHGDGELQPPPFWAPPSLDGQQALALGPEASYEDLCRAHIEAFISAAAAAETQTALGARVSDWRTKIGPILEEQAERDEFDTHAVGTALLERMQQLSVTEMPAEAEEVPNLEFGQVSAQTSQWEVARNFSALLQLVNAGNVGVQRGPWPGADSATHLQGTGHSFRLRLLCLAPAHQRLQGFLAPSLALQQVEREAVTRPEAGSPLKQLNRSKISKKSNMFQAEKRQKTASSTT